MTKNSIVAAAALMGIAITSSKAADESEIARAGALYKKNCMGCHQPPDLGFTTDRAWVGQIRETA